MRIRIDTPYKTPQPTLSLLWKQFLIESLKGEPSKERDYLTVTEVIDECLLRTVYSRIYSDWERDEFSIKNASIGLALHQYTDYAKSEVIAGAVKTFIEMTSKQVFVKSVTSEMHLAHYFNGVLLTGRLDHYIELEVNGIEERVILDKKFTTSTNLNKTISKNMPRYWMQVNSYALLLWRSKNVLPTRGVVQFMQVQNGYKPDTCVEFSITEQNLLELEKEYNAVLPVLMKAIREKNVDEIRGVKGSHCQYCPFRSKCKEY